MRDPDDKSSEVESGANAPAGVSLAPARASKAVAGRVLAVRLALLLAAGALAAAGIGVAVRDEMSSAAAAARYACPMHPEATAAAPGTCPICKMALEPTAAARREAPPPTAPLAAGAREDRPAADKPRALPAGTIPIAARSPQLGATWLPESMPPVQAGKPSDRVPTAAPSRRTFTNAVRAHAWLEAPDRLAAVVFRDDLAGLEPGARATFFRAAAPVVPVEVRLTATLPEDWDGQTVVVRFEVAAGARAGTLRAGEAGALELPDRKRALLIIPENALLRSPDGPYVLLASADASAGAGDAETAFTRRPVEIGRIFQGQVAVMSGLAETDRIVTGNAFFLDIEQRAEAPAGHGERGEHAGHGAGGAP